MIDVTGKDRDWIFSGIGVFVLGGVFWVFRNLGAALYGRLRGFPFTKFRVNPFLQGHGDGVGLIFRNDILVGKHVGGAWTFKATNNDWAVFGPYLREPLRKGSYRATFRLKIDDALTENMPIIEIHVASKTKYDGDKLLSCRSLTPLDFKAADQYRAVCLDFDALTDEQFLELRIWSKGLGHQITLDFVQLSRRFG